MKQLLSAIYYCYQNNVVHRDLKPENIMLEDSKDKEPIIKLIDWGGVRYFSKHKKMIKVNGPLYNIEPEVLSEIYDEKCEIQLLVYYIFYYMVIHLLMVGLIKIL